jgi:putative ABC transport system substrate-binding protein
VALPSRGRSQRAQQVERVRRVGVLTTFADSDALAQGWDAAFRKGLDESGWHNGRNVQIDYRWAAGDADRLWAFAKELVVLQPDVIFAVTTPTVAALLRETRTLPIVFAQVSDPVGSGPCRVARAAGRQRHGVHQHQHRIVDGRQMAGAR